ncbi:CPBP family intramembrane glutamic endopeptidase [Veronia nyctiphanis]|uniref:CPBP family intramembrane glutamic endopeptidase n=1 Tax=Veronia nyctiphanis TaxID=1278244 RepID=UPI00191BF06E|nr:CPBP family intramembrane glutamic endopeptidase [Veronia nyctiphanis]
MTQENFRWAEFFTVFFLLPVTAFHYREYLNFLLLPALCLVACVCLYLMVTDSRFKRFRLTNYENLGSLLWRSALLFVLGGIVTAVVVGFILDKPLFAMLLDDIYTWGLLIVLYPLFSVIPQELIFRTYLFHRFKHQMPNKTTRIFVSAFVFALAHIVYANWVAILLSFIGGLMFAYTYSVTRSTLPVLSNTVFGVSGCFLSLWPIPRYFADAIACFSTTHLYLLRPSSRYSGNIIDVYVINTYFYFVSLNTG